MDLASREDILLKLTAGAVRGCALMHEYMTQVYKLNMKQLKKEMAVIGANRIARVEAS